MTKTTARVPAPSATLTGLPVKHIEEGVFEHAVRNHVVAKRLAAKLVEGYSGNVAPEEFNALLTRVSTLEIQAQRWLELA